MYVNQPLVGGGNDDESIALTRLYPTCDTLLMTRLATEAVERIFRLVFRYSKAEVLLLDLRQPGEFSEDLFAHKQSVECGRLM